MHGLGLLVILVLPAMAQVSYCDDAGVIDYGKALSKCVLFLEAQRSGGLPNNQRIAWRANSGRGLLDGKANGVDLTAGGDNVKFGLPMAFTVTMMAWSVLEYGEQMGAAGELGHAVEAINADAFGWDIKYPGVQVQVLASKTKMLLQGKAGAHGVSMQCPSGAAHYIVVVGSNPREAHHRSRGASVKSNNPAFVSCHDLEGNNWEQGEATTYSYNSAPSMDMDVLAASHGGSGRFGGSLPDELATAAIQRDNRTSVLPSISPAAALHASPVAIEQNATSWSWSEKALPADEMAAILAPVAAYWITSGIYALLAVWCTAYRLHSKLEESRNLVPKIVVFRTVVLQQVLQAAVSLVLFKFNPRGAADRDHSTGHTPAFVLAGQFLVGMVVLDGWQYLGHRLMHQSRFLYRHVHSWHHRVVAPYAFAAQFNHPVEGLFLDTISGGLALLVSGMSPLTSAFFLSFATIKGVDHHAGMMIPYNPLHLIFGNNTAYHDLHHQLRGNRCNFSQPFFRFWDIAMGTYVPYSIVRAAHGGLEAVPTPARSKAMIHDAPSSVGVAQGGANKALGGVHGRRVDQAVAYLLMAAALAVTYLVH